ncbi:MAG: rod shape-determining protein MreD [Elusimicrobiota bacterium]
MKVARSAAAVALLFFTAAFCQWLWSTHFGLDGFSPQILLIATIFAAASGSRVFSMSLGFFWGLFLDSMGVGIFGANALALVLIAYLVGVVRRQMDVAKSAPQFVIVWIGTWIYFALLGVISLIFERNFFWPGWAYFLTLPLYNALLAAALALFRPRRRMA